MGVWGGVVAGRVVCTIQAQCNNRRMVNGGKNNEAPVT